MARAPIGPRPSRIARLVPAVRLLRAVGMAFDARPLILAALGLTLLWAGWEGIDRAFGRPGGGRLGAVPSWATGLGDDGRAPGRLERGLPSPAWMAGEPFRVIVAPFEEVFSTGQGPSAFLRASLAAVWSVIVWGFVGGAIARIAAVQNASGERVGIRTALRFALAHALGLVGGPLCPMIGIGFFAALCAAMGLLYALPGPAGATIAGCMAFLPLLAGLVMTLLVVGLAVGWPLMIATVAVESEDAFDALSRSYSYVYGRPGRYAAYLAIAWAAGAAGLMIAWYLAAAVVQMAQWGLSFGGPDERIAALFLGNPAAGPAATAHAFWLYVVRLLAHGWIYGYFFTASTLVYVLLRRDVDGTPYHDLVAGPADDEPFAPGPERPAEVESERRPSS